MTTRPLPFPAPLDCAAVDERLAEWLDDPASDAAVERHVAGCARCADLVADLRAVSAEARALPPLPLPDGLWDGIAARLGPQERPAGDETPVIALDAYRERRPAPALRVRQARRRDLPQRWRLAAAAVALVAVTAGITHRLSRPGAPAASLASTPAGPAAPAAGAAPTGSPAVVADAGAAARTPSDSAARPADAASGAEAPAAERPGARRASGARVVAVANPDAAVPGAEELDREITALRTAVRERRGELDSATVAVLVRNLVVIDQAIKQSRAALARDPHSPFLGDQLTRALGQKVELLRTAALIPRT